MAYNNGFPASYQPYYNPYLQNAMQNQMMSQMMQNQMQGTQQQQTIQQSGFVLVQSEQEARAYPVAPGNSITFKDESQPYCYVKTMGFNQLDRPTFERYRLVKEDETPQAAPTSPPTAGVDTNTTYALKSDIEALWGEIEALKAKRKPKKEEPENE